jgi:hypothetical protein
MDQTALEDITEIEEKRFNTNRTETRVAHISYQTIKSTQMQTLPGRIPISVIDGTLCIEVLSVFVAYKTFRCIVDNAYDRIGEYFGNTISVVSDILKKSE